jgi:glutamate-5-semialdehyde dehydrogenase
MSPIRKQAERAKAASAELAVLPVKIKNQALGAMAKAILANKVKILAENVRDILRAKKAGISQSMLQRLALDEFKLVKMAASVASIGKLPDPVGRLLSENKRPNGLRIRKVSVPIGVILIIYESRPNVTADCMALCLKSGNSVILRGGGEALSSNKVIFEVMNAAAHKKGVPAGAFEFIDTPERSAVEELLKLNNDIDLVIPRGGEGLIRRVAEHSRIPVIKHYKGVCHVFVDAKADLKKAEAIAVNAKTQNPSVCNAMETLLVHESIASKFLPSAARALRDKGVDLRCDERAMKFVPGASVATEEDWRAEYLDLILSVRVVKDIGQAVEHIRQYGSKHSDAIITEDKKNASAFQASVDSACVFVNCSTRFNDGGEFGMGAEMGISTDKLHARGPMGLEELTTYKYIVTGTGQTRG